MKHVAQSVDVAIDIVGLILTREVVINMEVETLWCKRDVATHTLDQHIQDDVEDETIKSHRFLKV